MSIKVTKLSFGVATTVSLNSIGKALYMLGEFEVCNKTFNVKKRNFYAF